MTHAINSNTNSLSIDITKNAYSDEKQSKRREKEWEGNEERQAVKNRKKIKKGKKIKKI